MELRLGKKTCNFLIGWLRIVQNDVLRTISDNLRWYHVKRRRNTSRIHELNFVLRRSEQSVSKRRTTEIAVTKRLGDLYWHMLLASTRK